MQLAEPKEYADHLFRVISGKRFLNKEGLGNEVPFFICPFPVQVSVDVGVVTSKLIGRLRAEGVSVLEINLYDLAIELLKERGIFETILDQEQSFERDELLEILQNVLDAQDHIAPAIETRMGDAEFDVLFITGVGEVFPYLRSHNLLNNLQSKAKNQPTVLFFPGEYTRNLETGASLRLFGLLEDDKYYRAFNIMHYEA